MKRKHKMLFVLELMDHEAREDFGIDSVLGVYTTRKLANRARRWYCRLNGWGIGMMVIERITLDWQPTDQD